MYEKAINDFELPFSVVNRPYNGRRWEGDGSKFKFMREVVFLKRVYIMVFVVKLCWLAKLFYIVVRSEARVGTQLVTNYEFSAPRDTILN